MKILALDPATHTGWAHSAGPSGVWDLTPGRDDSRGMRLIKLQRLLRETYKTHGIDLITFEAVRHASVKNQATAMIVQAELQSVIKVFCENYGIEYAGVSSSTIKRFATGKGNANKEAMLKSAIEDNPFVEVIDDNHADALHLLNYSQRQLI